MIKIIILIYFNIIDLFKFLVIVRKTTYFRYDKFYKKER